MGMKVKDLLERAVKNIMLARTEVVSQGWNVYTARDATNKRDNNFILVGCGSSNRIAPNADFYKYNLEIIAVSQSEEDLGGFTNLAMHEECEEEINQDLTKVTLQAAIDAVQFNNGITIDGLVPLQGAEDRSDYHDDRSMVEINLTYVTPV